MYIYENSIVDDINNLFSNSVVSTVIADSLDEGLRRSATKNEDKVALPLIILTGGDWELKDVNFYSLMHGSKFKIESTADISDKSKANIIKNINIIPVKLNYDMYVLATSSRECDMLTREILFHYFMHPTSTIKIPYGIDILHTFNISFNSNIRKQTRTGLVYRVLNFYIDDAFLWHNNTISMIKDTNTTVNEKYENNT